MTKQARCYWEAKQEAELAELDRRRKAERAAVEKAMDEAMEGLGEDDNAMCHITLADGRRVYSKEHKGGHRAVLGESDAVCLRLQGISVGQVQRIAGILNTGRGLLGDNERKLIGRIAEEGVHETDLAAHEAILDNDIQGEFVTECAQMSDMDMRTLEGLELLRKIQNPSLYDVFAQAMRQAPQDLELRQMAYTLFRALDLLGVRR